MLLDMVGGKVRETQLRFVDEAGAWVSTTVERADGAAVVRGTPVRTFPTYKGQRNYPGLLWTATTQSLVGYESLLECDRLWLADFDPDVRWVASQPFWVSGRDGAVLRRHVPDFMVETTKGYTVIDVKPADLLAEPEVADVMTWTGRLCSAKGWAYEVWSGADRVLLRNVRFLAAGRRPELADEQVLGKVAVAGSVGMTLAQAEAAARVDAMAARSASLSLLWSGRWTTDLSRPLTAQSLLTGVA